MMATLGATAQPKVQAAMALLEPGIARIQIFHAFVGADPQLLDSPIGRIGVQVLVEVMFQPCLLYTSPSPRDS